MKERLTIYGCSVILTLLFVLAATLLVINDTLTTETIPKLNILIPYSLMLMGAFAVLIVGNIKGIRMLEYRLQKKYLCTYPMQGGLSCDTRPCDTCPHAILHSYTTECDVIGCNMVHKLT